MRKLAIAGIIGATGALVVQACLPGDTRPTPAAVHFQVEPSEETLAGFTTVDGWTITFERILAGVGNTWLDGDACNDYSYTFYTRLIDFTVAGRQKLSDVYGLGTCNATVWVQWPNSDTLLGEGVTEDDLVMMRENFEDPSYGGKTSTSVYVRGKAVKGGVEKRFEWRLNMSFPKRDCPVSFEEVGATFVGGEEVPMVVTMHGEELFRDSLDAGAALRFDPMAAADEDDDQSITEEELLHVPGPDFLPDASSPLEAPDGGPVSLWQVVMTLVLPSVVHVDGNKACHKATQ